MLRTILVPSQDKKIGVPKGGTTGQVLAKASDQDGDLTWTSDAPVQTVSSLDTNSDKPINSQAVFSALTWNDIQGH